MARSTRDYAKKTKVKKPNKKNTTKTTKTTRRQSSKSKKSSMGLWIFTFALVVGLVAGGAYFVALDKTLEPQHKPQLAKRKAIKQAKKNLPEKPRFEFYNILPKLRVQTKKSKAVVKKQHRYDVQVASTRDYHDAEQMRARIILHGLDAHVIRVKTRSGLWYRVALGPYDSSTDAETVLKQLRKNDLDGIIRRID